VPVSLTSVVLPVYNGEAALRRALESVFAQDRLLRLSTITPFHYSPAMLAFCDDRNWGSAEKRIDTCACYDGYLYQKFPECLNNLAVACARVGDARRARDLLEQAIVQQAFSSDAIGNLQALESDADPATLRATSRRVFQ
jgi:hypothetical protein